MYPVVPPRLSTRWLPRCNLTEPLGRSPPGPKRHMGEITEARRAYDRAAAESQPGLIVNVAVPDGCCLAAAVSPCSARLRQFGMDSRDFGGLGWALD